MNPGGRLKSAICDAEGIVVRCGDGLVMCGGMPMADSKPAALLEPHPNLSTGTLMGKRYVSHCGRYELLCVKPGRGSLDVDGVALSAKDPKSLPSSD